MSLSRTEEMHRLTENVYKTIMEQFNPSLRNFIAMGKNYEKALAGVTYAAKGYFDALVKMGELASESQGSKELGKTPSAAETPDGCQVVTRARAGLGSRPLSGSASTGDQGLLVTQEASLREP
ncbi:brain-specific angiogenesis inhibitor 1-associated protein 2-like [Ursus americanus]|uniref:brain-specific angiogenesis inhibitor 1-associated protein 2-like n=1 Tax=Ursus americanus TaxID=9643 RepID=UPI001E67AC20|nr:brain-specific angiogenesis inhibitor 1-associated protein 2-like [Ursus americanus]